MIILEQKNKPCSNIFKGDQEDRKEKIDAECLNEDISHYNLT